jgi:putative addiction module component (TIGR02574 family)
MNTKELIEQVVSLPVEERALVVDSVLRSLNPPQSDIDKQWGIVAQQRLAQMKAGEVKTIPGEQVFDRVWKRFDK